MNNRLRPPLRERERRRDDFDLEGVKVHLGHDDWVMRVPRAVWFVENRPGVLPRAGFCVGTASSHNDELFLTLWRGYEEADEPDPAVVKELAALSLYQNYALSGPEIEALLPAEVVASEGFQQSVRLLAMEAGARLWTLLGPKLKPRRDLHGGSADSWN